MAFISEINYLGGGGEAGGEFVEITLRPGEDPDDFIVSFYRNNGTLHTTASSSTATGEISLGDLTGVPDPENPGFTIYVIPAGIRNAASTATEATGVALTDTSTGGGTIDFYSSFATAPIVATTGAASGQTSETNLDHTALSTGNSLQWDGLGNEYIGATSSGNSVVCLSGDCSVETISGPVLASALKQGDLIKTHDHGYQTLRWVGRDAISAIDMLKSNNLRPIEIAQGALNPTSPAKPILVSRQHRVLIRSRVAARMFGTPDVLVAACKLVDFDGIETSAQIQKIEYIHLLFDHHELIEVNGTWVESLLRADWMTDESHAHFQEGIPVAVPALEEGNVHPARMIPVGKPLKKMLRRIHQNDKLLVEAIAQHDAVEVGA